CFAGRLEPFVAKLCPAEIERNPPRRERCLFVSKVAEMDELESRSYLVKEHMRFQRRTRTIERVGWLVLGFIILVASFGVFGSGLLSNANIAKGSLAIDYERITDLVQFREWLPALRTNS